MDVTTQPNNSNLTKAFNITLTHFDTKLANVSFILICKCAIFTSCKLGMINKSNKIIIRNFIIRKKLNLVKWIELYRSVYTKFELSFFFIGLIKTFPCENQFLVSVCSGYRHSFELQHFFFVRL